MKRLFFAALMTVCSVSWAGWVETGSTVSEIFYHDKSTIRRDGKIAKMWTMVDYFEEKTNRSGMRYKSDKTRFSYNCLEETYAIISLFQYSGSMGGGVAVYSFDWKEKDWDWGSIPPGSAAEAHFKIACGKK